VTTSLVAIRGRLRTYHEGAIVVRRWPRRPAPSASPGRPASAIASKFQPTAAPGKAKEELEAFGSWASSKLFLAAWFLAELERVLRLVRDIDRDHTVMERLKELANELPHETVRVAHLMVEFDAGWGPSGWESELEQILNAALPTADPEARKEALSLVDLLGRKGFVSFRELRK
jgi:hypothetical protein